MNLKKFIRTPYGKLALAGVVFMFCIGYMLIQVIGSLGNIMPTQNDIIQAEKDRQTAKNNFEQ
ncbi:MAG: hypothetical protein MST10_05000 [Lentisphaeria bacterium]|nr:hypothetical protein [Lentisphaeria bacterium]